MYCAKHFIVSPWPGELLPLVWNDRAPLMVPQSQRISEFSKKLELEVVLVYAVVVSVASCVIRLFGCAAMDLALVLQCWFLTALTDASHCFLSLWGRVRVFSRVSWNSALDACGIPFLLILYCSCMLALILRSLIQFGCFLCYLSLQ